MITAYAVEMCLEQQYVSYLQIFLILYVYYDTCFKIRTISTLYIKHINYSTKDHNLFTSQLNPILELFS